MEINHLMMERQNPSMMEEQEWQNRSPLMIL